MKLADAAMDIWGNMPEFSYGSDAISEEKNRIRRVFMKQGRRVPITIATEMFKSNSGKSALKGLMKDSSIGTEGKDYVWTGEL